MIETKKDYKYYLLKDKEMICRYGADKKKLFLNGIYKFERLLRKCEYYKNCRKDILGKVYFLYLRYKYNKECVKYGFTIPFNAFKEGLSIAHRGTIVVNSKARIGKNCRIHADVNIGEAKGGYPTIGDNVYIGPGAKIFGNITLGDNIVIGANAVVNKSFDEGTIAGVPAKRIDVKI